MFTQTGYSLGELWFLAFAGIPVPSRPDRTFRFPVTWYLMIISALLITLIYMEKDLAGVGPTLLLHSQKRGRWLASKLVWIILQNAMYFTILYLLGVLFTLIYRAPLTLRLDPEMISHLLQTHVDDGRLLMHHVVLFLSMPFIATCLLAGFQFLLQLVVSPVLAFAASLFLIIAALFYPTPCFLPTLLPIRFEPFIGGMSQFSCGALCSCPLSG